MVNEYLLPGVGLVTVLLAVSLMLISWIAYRRNKLRRTLIASFAFGLYSLLTVLNTASYMPGTADPYAYLGEFGKFLQPLLNLCILFLLFLAMVTER